jgi:hypothetical protein
MGQRRQSNVALDGRSAMTGAFARTDTNLVRWVTLLP